MTSVPVIESGELDYVQLIPAFAGSAIRTAHERRRLCASAARDSGALGLTPCYALLGAAGFDLMVRHRLARAAVYGWMACFALFAYAAYPAL
jgi:hypothetical protein